VVVNDEEVRVEDVKSWVPERSVEVLRRGEALRQINDLMRGRLEIVVADEKTARGVVPRCGLCMSLGGSLSWDLVDGAIRLLLVGGDALAEASVHGLGVVSLSSADDLQPCAVPRQCEATRSPTELARLLLASASEVSRALRYLESAPCASVEAATKVLGVVGLREIVRDEACCKCLMGKLSSWESVGLVLEATVGVCARESVVSRIGGSVLSRSKGTELRKQAEGSA
jgi:hypothetical protein